MHPKGLEVGEVRVSVYLSVRAFKCSLERSQGTLYSLCNAKAKRIHNGSQLLSYFYSVIELYEFSAHP